MRGPHTSVTQRQSTVVGRCYLADGENSDKTDPTYVIYSLTHVDWYPWWQHRRIGDTSSPAMVSQRCYAKVCQLLQATARLGKKHTSSVVMTRTYLDYLGFGWKHRRGCPRARRCGGESATALRFVFRTGEATIRGDIMLQARLHPNQALT